MPLRLLIAACLVLVIPIGSSLAEEGNLRIKPGKYKITQTTQSNYDTKPQVVTKDSCIQDPVLNPEYIVPDKKNCKVKNLKSDGQKASFDLVCAKPGNQKALSGHADYSTTGTGLKFSMDLKGTFRGKPLLVSIYADGRRIGECE